MSVGTLTPARQDVQAPLCRLDNLEFRDRRATAPSPSIRPHQFRHAVPRLPSTAPAPGGSPEHQNPIPPSCHQAIAHPQTGRPRCLVVVLHPPSPDDCITSTPLRRPGTSVNEGPPPTLQRCQRAHRPASRRHPTRHRRRRRPGPGRPDPHPRIQRARRRPLPGLHRRAQRQR